MQDSTAPRVHGLRETCDALGHPSIVHTVVLGATGFVGRTVVLMLQARSHAVEAIARDARRAAHQLPAGVRVTSFAEDAELAAAVARADVIVNLAGEPIAGRRWTRKRKQQLLASRVGVTRRLVAAIAQRARALPVFVSASATGWYGDRGDLELDEQSSPGDGFAAELCDAWEAAALEAAAVRVVLARFGVILGREGGALATLRPIYRLGLGGPIGDGAAWLPWIHLDDAARAVLHAIEHPALDGPIAVVAPDGVRQRDFARAYARSLQRPAVIRTPRLALRALFGEAAEVLTGSQHVVPRALLASGFRFQYPTLERALGELAEDGVSITRAGGVSDDNLYLKARGARYLLRTTTTLPAPRDDVFAFFSAPENLGALTPPSLGFEIAGDAPSDMKTGALIDYRIRLARLALRWRTRIEHWEPGRGFVDSQLRGPYRSWWHEHRFIERDGVTEMQDLVHFSPPLAGLGRLAVEGMLRRIFGYRRAMIRARFDLSGRS